MEGNWSGSTLGQSGHSVANAFEQRQLVEAGEVHSIDQQDGSVRQIPRH
jgi:hypothetical protein